MWVLPLMVTIVATAEVQGTPEPCGCNSDPLGDVARVATLAKGGVWLRAGAVSYNPAEQASVGLGADDLLLGPKGVKGARQACNVRGMALQAPRVQTVNGVKVGVFGV